ncbi:hypothetical protein ENBRE01_0183 [Enteropsectra breve]|nr:hypothetical protein ENBRE01_0183 [Enteropsectra breve]
MSNCPSVESGLAGKADSCKGCPNASKCASAKPDEAIPLIKENIKNVKLFVAVLSGKGGVGKSTVSTCIAHAISQMNYKTLLLDLDLSGPSIPRLTNTMNAYIPSGVERIKPISISPFLHTLSSYYFEGFEDSQIVFDANVKTHLIKKMLKDTELHGIDVVVIDTPPNITDEHLALVNYIKPHCGVMVTTPQGLSLDDTNRQVTFCKKANIEILGMVENMKNFLCKKCGHVNTVFKDVGVAEYCSAQNISYLGSLEINQSIAKSGDSGIMLDIPLFKRIAKMLKDKIDANAPAN